MVGDTWLRPANFISVRSSDELPVAEPEMLRSPPVSYTHLHELDVLRWLLNDDYRSVQVRFPRSTSHTHARLKDPQICLLYTSPEPGGTGGGGDWPPPVRSLRHARHNVDD